MAWYRNHAEGGILLIALSSDKKVETLYNEESSEEKDLVQSRPS